MDTNLTFQSLKFRLWNHIKLNRLVNVYADKVDYFLSENTNLKITNKRGDSVLHVAAKRGHIDLMLTLIQNGADDSKRNYLGQLPEVCQLNYLLYMTGA